MSDRTWINKKERYEVIPERELNALKAKNTALVEACSTLADKKTTSPWWDIVFKISDWNDFEHALAAAQEKA